MVAGQSHLFNRVIDTVKLIFSLKDGYFAEETPDVIIL